MWKVIDQHDTSVGACYWNVQNEEFFVSPAHSFLVGILKTGDVTDIFAITQISLVSSWWWSTDEPTVDKTTKQSC